MTTSAEMPSTSAPKSLPARVLGVLFAPRETFQDVAAHPRWFGMLVLLVVFVSAATFIFLSTEVGRQATLDQQVSVMESFGMEITDEVYDRMERQAAMSAYFGAGSQLAVLPIMYLVMSGILFAIFTAGTGGQASFKQLFAVVTHSGAITIVQQLFTLPLNYARGSMSSPTNLGALLPMLPEGSFLANLLGTVDLFIIWWLVVLAIGLAVLYRRKTQPIAITLFVIYGVIALVIAGVRSWMGGS